MKLVSSVSCLAVLCIAPACTISTRSAPPRIQSWGVIEGHAALGIAAEEHLLHARLFDGRSDGSLFEFVLWKLFRLELGVVGASISVGPVHLGLGALAYEPEVPRMIGRKSKHRTEHEKPERRDPEPAEQEPADVEYGVEGCAECEAVRNQR